MPPTFRPICAQRIEFNRVQRVKTHRGCFLMRKSESIRYKFAGVSVPGDRNKKNKQRPFGPATSKAGPKVTDALLRAEVDKKLRTAAQVPLKNKPMQDKQHEAQSQNKADKMKQGALSGERIELYHFDHGNATFFCTTDCQPTLHTDRLARETADTATRFWAEMYGSMHIVIAIVVAFVLQSLRFVLYSIVRPLLVGSVQICGDYVFKPMLTAGFNACVQPPLVFVQNVLQSIEQMLRPVCTMVRNAVEPVAMVASSLRLVEINHHHHYPADREMMAAPGVGVVFDGGDAELGQAKGGEENRQQNAQEEEA